MFKRIVFKPTVLLALVAALSLGLSGVASAAVINGTPLDDQRIRGTSSDDQMHGLAGNDNLYGWDPDGPYSVVDGNDTIWGDEGKDMLFGGFGKDSLLGGVGDDYLIGHSGDDWMRGDEGDDRLFGEGGNDSLGGGPGNDRLDGAWGDDRVGVTGASGQDLLFGGRFVNNDGNDTIIATGDPARDDERDGVYCGDGYDTAYLTPAPWYMWYVSDYFVDSSGTPTSAAGAGCENVIWQ
jgi:Ca2+-binding RTX toxin-like protein